MVYAPGRENFVHLSVGLSQAIATSAYLVETSQHPDHKHGWNGDRVFGLFEHNGVAFLEL